MKKKIDLTIGEWFRATKKRYAVPAEMQDKAIIPGIKDARIFADEPQKTTISDIIESMKQESAGDFPVGADGIKAYPVLILSGGSSNGAYGAGLLKGWSEQGSRPNFKVVTGISTGALIAPPAFIGSDYDDTMKKFFTSSATKNIMQKQGPVRGLLSGSLASSRPLERIIRENYDKELLKKIAAAHTRGRRLYIGTANLDAQRLVLWNIGKIALVGDDKALALFHKIILASSAMPILFPPVFFDVEVDGKHFDEVHVDGCAISQLSFLYGATEGLSEAARKEGISKEKRLVKLYVIRNGYLEPKWQSVPGNIPSLAKRSIETMIYYQAAGDIFRLYVAAKKKGHDFNLAYIPSEHESMAKEMFDLKEMIKLFDFAREQALKGYPWEKKPPMLKKAGIDLG